MSVLGDLTAAPSTLHQPASTTPLEFHLTGAQYRQARALIGECAFCVASPLITVLDQAVQQQCPESVHPGDIGDDTTLVFHAAYEGYLRVLGALSQLPYVRVAQFIQELARQAEGQLQSASRLRAGAQRLS